MTNYTAKLNVAKSILFTNRANIFINKEIKIIENRQ